jgi:hypothetical protein
MGDPVTIELSGDEALVLYEWLAEHEEKLAVGEAERRVLWRLEGALEKSLAEVFAKDYVDLVEQARRRILAE